MKVSFDFDGVLDVEDVQDFARELVRRGIEVWVVTNRPNDDEAPSPNWNLDLYGAVNYVGVLNRHIKFLNMSGKTEFFKSNPNFIWHLDDNWTEASDIAENTPVMGIPFGSRTGWKAICLDLIDKFN